MHSPNIPEKEEKTEGVTRFSVSLPVELARQLDAMASEKGYSNRSLAIADMVRAQLVEHQSGAAEQIAGTITLLFDHHKPRLQSLLTDVQHDHTDVIVSTLHVHLDHDNCLEVLVVRGDAAEIRALADALIAAKGVKHGRLTVTATGKDLPLHTHSHYDSHE
jgi:CopG family nickel-responsive transcriptional regulator